MIRKKWLVLLLFSHRTNVLDICSNRLTDAILTNNQNMFFEDKPSILPLFLDKCQLLSERFVSVKLSL